MIISAALYTNFNEGRCLTHIGREGADQIREVLIHGNYLSQKDVDICAGFDLETLAHNPGIASIRELHDALVANYTAHDAEVRA